MLSPSWSCSLFPITVMNANIHCTWHQTIILSSLRLVTMRWNGVKSRDNHTVMKVYWHHDGWKWGLHSWPSILIRKDCFHRRSASLAINCCHDTNWQKTNTLFHLRKHTGTASENICSCKRPLDIYNCTYCTHVCTKHLKDNPSHTLTSFLDSSFSFLFI